ncbi:IS3 family transposase [Bacillus thuringiensis]
MWVKSKFTLHLNQKRIQRLMSELGIRAVIRTR